MARQPRLTVAAYPHHVIQRGNDRQAIVRDDADRERDGDHRAREQFPRRMTTSTTKRAKCLGGSHSSTDGGSK